jgi:hypothetical protein
VEIELAHRYRVFELDKGVEGGEETRSSVTRREDGVQVCRCADETKKQVK